MWTGRCLCGACAYTIEGDPIVVAHCHCLDCQRGTGAGHATSAMFDAAGITITGDPSVYEQVSEAGNTVTRLFCGGCGSQLFGRNTGMPGVMAASLGTLDQADELTPQVAIFARARRHWDAVDPALPTYDGQPDWKPGDDV
ncbi:GFA family protein [uncultured Phenylobacterium sp.]|uniref:GFA family protein n=1 Tax=uncultured Phenylobacterium sp. TaxID=349273 RepID=UPI002600E93C|nr:GFA family protein [uncultured Phenylobacterium sp.]